MLKLRLLHRLYYRYKEMRERVRQFRYQNRLSNGTVSMRKGCYITPDSIFEGENRIGDHCVLKSVDMGYGSYMGSDCYFEKTSIGRYCSIANNVRITASHHPTSKWVSTHPAFYSKDLGQEFGFTDRQLYDEYRYADVGRKKFVCIGNDVWIGAEATILEGVTVGDGAVIAAKAMVTKDVAPYEVRGGGACRTYKMAV